MQKRPVNILLLLNAQLGLELHDGTRATLAKATIPTNGTLYFDQYFNRTLESRSHCLLCVIIRFSFVSGLNDASILDLFHIPESCRNFAPFTQTLLDFQCMSLKIEGFFPIPRKFARILRDSYILFETASIFVASSKASWSDSSLR